MKNLKKFFLVIPRIMLITMAVSASTAYGQRASTEDIYGDSVRGVNLFDYIVLSILGALLVWGVIKIKDIRTAVFRYVGLMAGLFLVAYISYEAFGKVGAMVAGAIIAIAALLSDPAFSGSTDKENNKNNGEKNIGNTKANPLDEVSNKSKSVEVPKGEATIQKLHITDKTIKPVAFKKWKKVGALLINTDTKEEFTIVRDKKFLSADEVVEGNWGFEFHQAAKYTQVDYANVDGVK